MSDATLPPKPDPDTGLPRPPAGPLDNSWGSSHRHPTDRTTVAPESPPGQSRTLEWIPRSWKKFKQYSIFYVILLVGFITLKDWGIAWVEDWRVWLMVAVLSGLGALATWSSDDMAAGADWFRYGKTWVKIYELTEVKLDKAMVADNLELKDAVGHEVSITITSIQNNLDLWNLVYNGILYSVHEGGAMVNERARDRLRLDLDDPLLSDGDST
jgi:hypothetical protein